MFGKARKTVKVGGQKFNVVYSMSKVLIHESPPSKNRISSTQEAPVRVHGPYQQGFDYTPFMPKKRNGRWSPGKWLPLIEKKDQSMCISGYHGCTMDKTNRWSGYGSDRSRERVWLIEGVGPITTDPKSQEPMTTKIIYRLTQPRGQWQDGRWVQPKSRRKRDRVGEKIKNGKVLEARENGGHIYDVSVDKYNFQSIRIIRPITNARKLIKKAPERAPTTWRYIKPPGSRGSIRVKVYAKTGFLVPGQGVKMPRKKR